MIKSKVIDINVVYERCCFDEACRDAYQRALMRFGIDDSGHAEDERFPRSCSSLEVEFIKYSHSGGMGGQTFFYKFKAWMECIGDGVDEECSL